MILLVTWFTVINIIVSSWSTGSLHTHISAIRMCVIIIICLYSKQFFLPAWRMRPCIFIIICFVAAISYRCFVFTSLFPYRSVLMQWLYCIIIMIMTCFLLLHAIRISYQQDGSHKEAARWAPEIPINHTQREWGIADRQIVYTYLSVVNQSKRKKEYAYTIYITRENLWELWNNQKETGCNLRTQNVHTSINIKIICLYKVCTFIMNIIVIIIIIIGPYRYRDICVIVSII